MITFGVARAARSLTTTPDRLVGLAVLLLGGAAWLVFWTAVAVVGTGATLALLAAAGVAVAARYAAARSRRAAAWATWHAGFIPAVRPAVALLVAPVTSAAPLWGAVGLVVPPVLSVTPTPTGATVVVAMRPGQHRDDYATATAHLAAALGVAAVTLDAQRGTHLTLTLHT